MTMRDPLEFLGSGSPPRRSITAGRRSEAGATGRLLSANLAGAGIERGGSGSTPELIRPRGLCIFIANGQNDCAQCLLTIGTPQGGGAEVTRSFTLTRSGVWLTASAWTTVNLDIVSVGASDVRVGYMWTAQEPPTDESGRLVLIESISAGPARQIPAGAVAVTSGSTDASWSYTTDQDGTPLTFNVGLTAGQRQRVLGDLYTPTINNVLHWELWSP